MNIVIVGILVISVVWAVFTVMAFRSRDLSHASRLVAKSSIFGMISVWINLAPSVFRVSDAQRMAGLIVGLGCIAASAVFVVRAYRVQAENRAERR